MFKHLIHFVLVISFVIPSSFATESVMKDTNKQKLPPSTRFANKVILITGGTSGIGLATAVAFASSGAEHVIVCGRMHAKWNKAQEYIHAHLSDKQAAVIEYWSCDVRVEDEIKAVVEKIYAQYKHLDIAFNNAGVSPGIGDKAGDIENLVFDSRILEDGSIAFVIPGPQPHSTHTEDMRWQEKDFTQASPIAPYRENPIATSIFGVFYSMKWELIYAFSKQPRDLPMAIINTASRNGIIPDPNRPLYAASKAFIITLSKSLSNQVAQKSVNTKRAMIRINVIAPGPVDTPMERGAFPGKDFIAKASVGVPMQRVAQPDEIAQSVLFLADENTSGYITGAVLPIDGGDVASPYIPKS